LHSNMNLSRFVRKTDMAQYTLIARINAGDGEFPFVNVQFSKNHRPIPIERATYYLRPSNSGKRTPIRIGKDVAVAHTALIRMEDGQPLECIAALHAGPPSSIRTAALRRRVVEAAREYIERSKQKSRIEIWADFTCTITALYVQVDYFRARRHAEVEVSPRIGKG